MRALIFAGCLALAPLGALGAPQTSDARIQMVDYQPDQVVRIQGKIGYQLAIEFDVEERVENVSIGDSIGWQVTPNRRANILFLKPIDGTATNMTVITDHRRYVFDLEVQPKAASTVTPYAVRFVYPVRAMAIPVLTPPAPERPPEVANSAYAISGAQENLPTRVFDDGRMTYFEWPEDASLPAIFAVAADGSESIVNYVVREPFVVVEQIAGRFSLRNGAQVATVTNTTMAVEPKRRSRR